MILGRWGSLVGVAKPSGVLVHNSTWAGPRETSLREMLVAELGQQLFPLHRLDRGTSGVVLFVTDKSAVEPWRARLAKEGDDAAQKTYLALVRGRTLELGLVDHPVRSAGKRSRGERKEARSVIDAATLSAQDRCSLVVVRPLTGRHHQIRQHLSHLHHPVLGDATHGDVRENRRYRETWGLDRLALHALSVELADDDGGRLRIEAPVPGDLRNVFARLGLDDAVQP